MNNIELPKNIRYAIRMLNWHTRLVIKYTNIIQKYVQKNNLSCNKILNVKDSNKENGIANNQSTIFDYIN